MKYLLTLLIFLLHAHTNGQTPGNIVRTGISNTNMVITGQRTVLDGRICGYSIDTVGGELVVGVNAQGACSYITIIDLHTTAIKSRICVAGNIRNLHVNPQYITALTPRKLFSYSRATGREVWQLDIKNNMLGKVFNLSSTDSTFLYCDAETINFVNANTGRQLNYKIHTKWIEGKDLEILSAGVGLMGALTFGAMGVLVGGGIVSAFDGDYPQAAYSSACSNICVDSNIVYFADKDTLVCYNQLGRIIWKQPLPADSGSKSRIEIDNNRLYLLNYGYVHGANKSMIWRGEAFRACFNKANGKSIFSAPIPCNRYIFSTMPVGDTLLVHGEHFIHKLHRTTNQLFSTAKVKGTKAAEYLLLINGAANYLQTNAGTYKSLDALYPDSYFMAGRDSTALRTTKDFFVVDSFRSNKIWREISREGDIILLENNGRKRVVANGMIFGELDMKAPLLLQGKILDVADGSVTRADISQYVRLGVH